jgi:cytochrome c peroxidase
MNPVVRTVAVGVTAALALNGGAAAVDAQPGTQGVRTQNPCAAKNPCGAKNPCAAAAKVDPKMVTRPAGTKLMLAGRPDVVAEGARLWKDTKLSTNGLSCFTCHQNNASFKPTFAKPYPHPVEMPRDRAGLKQVNIDDPRVLPGARLPDP